MPCGGISPIENCIVSQIVKDMPKENRTCWFNDGGGAELWVEEWDSFLHLRCLIRFLQTDEGRCVMSHGHDIYIPYEMWATIEKDEENAQAR